MCRVYDNRRDPKLQTDKRPHTDRDDTRTSPATSAATGIPRCYYASAAHVGGESVNIRNLLWSYVCRKTTSVVFAAVYYIHPHGAHV